MAGSVNVGSADVTIVPDVQGFSAKVSAAITPQAKALGEQLGKLIGDAIQQRIQSGIVAGLGPSSSTRAQGTRQGNDYAGSFATAFRTRIDAAMKALPEIKLTANSSDAEIKLQGIRTQLETLSRATIGVDIDETTAITELEILKTKIDELNRNTTSIQVKADTAAAQAQLDLLIAEVRAVGAERPTIDVDADTAAADSKLAALGGEAESAGSGFSGLIAAGIALGPALIPVIAAVTAAAAGLVGVLGSLAVGGGVLALGFSGIAGGVKALDESQTKAASSGRSLASSALAVAGAQRQVEAAERSLKDARANADDAAIRSAEQVKNARQALATAEAAAAATIGDTASKVALALHNAGLVAQAEATAAQNNAAAQHTLEQAERDLASAQANALDAQNALTEARKTAAQQSEDLANQVIDGKNAERQANFDVADAQDALNAAKAADPTGQAEATQKAQLAYDQAVQHLNELQIQNQRLADQKAASDQAGIEGSAAVVAAQKNIVTANQSVADAQYAVTQATQQATATQKAGLDQIAAVHKQIADAAKASEAAQVQASKNELKAQQNLNDALRAQQQQQRQSAASIASALDAVKSAQDSLSKAGAAGGGGGIAASLSAAQQAYNKLDPIQKEFVRFIHDDLLPAFSGIKKAAADGLLPGVEAGLKLLVPVFKDLKPFVGEVAKALGELFLQGAKALKDPFWTQFFTFAAATVVPTLKGVAQFVGDLAGGFAGLLQAFAPVTGSIGGGMLILADNFEKFGEQAGKPGSPFQSFLGYVKEYLPLVGQFFGDLIGALSDVVQVAAPFGGMVLGLIDDVLKLVRAIGPTGLALVMIAIEEIFIDVTAGLGSFVIGLSLVAAAFLYLYGHSKTVHDFVNDHILPVFHELAGYFTDTVLPILKKIGGEAMDGIRDGLAIVGDAINQHKPQLTEIGDAFKDIVKIIVEKVVPVLGPVLKAAFEGAGAFIAGLIDIIAAIVTAFDKVQQAVPGIWDNITHGFAVGVNAVIDAINWFIKALDKIPGVSIGLIDHMGTSSGATSGTSNGTPVHAGPNKGFATGGVLPGYAPGIDSVHAILSPGEGVLVPEAVRMLGPDWVYAINAYASRGRGGARQPGHFSLGGIIGSIGDGIKSGIGTVTGVLTAPEHAAVNAAVSAAKHFANSTIPAGFFRDIADSTLDDIGNAFKFADGGVVGSAWSPILASAGPAGMAQVDGPAGVGGQLTQHLEVNNYHRPMTPADIVQGWNQHAALHGAPLLAGAGMGVG